MSATPSPNKSSAVELGTMSQSQLVKLRFSRHRLAVFSLYMLGLLYAMALLAEFWAPYQPNAMNLQHNYAPPQRIHFNLENGFYVYGLIRHINPIDLTTSYQRDTNTIVPLRFFVKDENVKLWGILPIHRHLFGMDLEKFEERNPDTETLPTFFLLGADQYGRDMFSRIVFGARISLSIGLVSIVISFVLGIIIGGISGFYGGVPDLIIQRLIEILNAIPGLPLWIALGAILPADWPDLKIYFGITVVLSLLGWTGLARTVRSKLLSLREEDYAVAARLLGASHGRVIFRHLVPGFTSHILVSLSLTVPSMILGETALSFLGLGLRPPVVSWGVLLQDCMNLDILARSPWLIMPTFFIILTVLAFNFVGDGLRDAADPYR
jgi:peptide/nickel transport system permease protein